MASKEVMIVSPEELKNLVYPTSSIVGRACGRGSHAYRLVYALERWAARHGYDGHHAHTVPTKRDKNKQQNIKF